MASKKKKIKAAVKYFKVVHFVTKSHVIRKTILVKGTINHQKWTKKKESGDI